MSDIKIVEVKIDASKLKNEMTELYNETFKATAAKTDMERRDLLAVIVEKMRTLKHKVDQL